MARTRSSPHNMKVKGCKRIPNVEQKITIKFGIYDGNFACKMKYLPKKNKNAANKRNIHAITIMNGSETSSLYSFGII